MVYDVLHYAKSVLYVSLLVMLASVIREAYQDKETAKDKDMNYIKTRHLIRCRNSPKTI